MKSNFYSKEELNKLSFCSFGEDVLISRKASIYGAEHISLGSHVRIDDFCILSAGRIEIGNYVHIGAYTGLYGAGGIKIGNFCGVSMHSLLLSATDDFSGQHMISPLVPEEYTSVKKALIELKDYVQLGAQTVVLPGVTAQEGAVTGACSLVLSDLPGWTINIGIPVRVLKKRYRCPKSLSENISCDSP